MLTNENIDLLLTARSQLDKYRADVKRYGKTPYIQYAFLKSFCFSDTASFSVFNLKMNLLEIDRCVRFRLISDTSKIALCDKCQGRSIVQCVVAGCGWHDRHLNNPNPMADFLTNKELDLGESQMVAEQKEEAQRLGLSINFYVPPLAEAITCDIKRTYAGYCIGRCFNIHEFQFDTRWGMEEYRVFGNHVMEMLNKANER